METLSQIQQTESERRNRAARYEQLTDQKLRFDRAIEILTGHITVADENLQILDTVAAAAAKLPPEVQGRQRLLSEGRRFVRQDIHDLKAHILAVVDGSREVLVLRKEKCQEQVRHARGHLKGITEALKEFS